MYKKTKEKLALRDAVVKEIIRYAESNQKIVVLDCDMGTHTRMKKFEYAYPERFYQIGISEQNAIGIAAGMARCGYIPVISSFATFCIGHAWDQIRHSVIYNEANVKIIGTHAGLTASEDGATHQCIEDLALMLVLPEIEVYAPMCHKEIETIIKHIFNSNMPAYIRIGRNETANIDANFTLGKATVLKGGESKLCIVSTGEISSEALEASNRLNRIGYDITVMHLGTLRPIDSDDLRIKLQKYDYVVTIEEHSVVGGLGDIVSLHINPGAQQIRMGMQKFGETGRIEQLRKVNNLDSDAIVRNAIKLLEGTYDVKQNKY